MPDAPEIGPLRSLQAFILLLVYGVLGILGTPGLDFLKAGDFKSDAQKAELRDQIGSPWADLAIVIAEINRELRVPLANKLEPLQKPARISQSWALYRDGPGKLRRMEVWVDGELKHRSADPEYDWLSPQLRNRRVRPMVESTTMKKQSPNWEGLARFISDRARQDFPGAQRVELRALSGPFPGRKLSQDHIIVVAAPSWKPELL